jgi:hypothetical protein
MCTASVPIYPEIGKDAVHIEADSGGFLGKDALQDLSTIYLSPANGGQRRAASAAVVVAESGIGTAAEKTPPPQKSPAAPIQHFEVVFHGRLRDRVLNLLQSGSGPWTRAQVVERLGLAYPEEAQRGLRELCERGLAVKVGHGRYRATGAASRTSASCRTKGLAWPAAERAAAGLSQDELAARAGVQRAYVSIIEQGRRKPSPDVRARLERALRGGRTN